MKKQSAGVSLIELMVSMALGLIISMSVVRAFIGSKEGFMLTQGSTQMQENGRLALLFLGEAASRAGFRPLGLTVDKAFSVNGEFGTEQVARSFFAEEGSEKFGVRFYGYADAFMRDCMGNSIPDQTEIRQVFEVINGALTCSVNGGAPEDVVRGIDALEVVYGIDGNGDGLVDQYLTSVETGLRNKWGVVRAVQFHVVARSFDNVSTLYNDTVYEMPRRDYVFNDNKVRQIFVGTFNVRNVVNRAMF